jgi:hypothetical protein
MAQEAKKSSFWLIVFAVCVIGIGAYLGIYYLSRSRQVSNACAPFHLAAAGIDALLPAYPFKYTEYWVWSAVPSDKPIVYKATGRYPYSRGMNYQAYDSANTLPADTIVDYNIVPDQGSSNPFLPNINRYVENRSYTVWFTPPAYTTGKQNVLLMPDTTVNGTENATMIYRIIRHDPVDHLPLPTIEAFDAATGQPVPCPRQGMPLHISTVVQAFKELFHVKVPVESPTFEFYRYNPDRFIPNTSTHYLTAAISPPDEGKLAGVWYRVPTFTDTYHDRNAMFTGKEEVRHSGICIHGLYSTTGVECLVDDEFPVGKDGVRMAYIIVGPDDDGVRKEAERRGYKYLHTGHFKYPLVMYRQRLPRSDFAGSAEKILSAEPTRLDPSVAASRYMGEYAPRGHVCTRDSFMSGNTCGLPTLTQESR